MAALRKLEAERIAIEERRRALEEQAALELGRIILGTGLEAFSRKGLARVASLLGKLGEEAALVQLGKPTVAPPSKAAPAGSE